MRNGRSCISLASCRQLASERIILTSNAPAGDGVGNRPQSQINILAAERMTSEQKVSIHTHMENIANTIPDAQRERRDTLAGVGDYWRKPAG